MVAVQTSSDSIRSSEDKEESVSQRETPSILGNQWQGADSLELLSAYFGSKTEETPVGDREVLSELFLRERETLFRFARKKGFSEVDAESIVSDCFYNLMSRQGSFDPDKATVSYLYKLLDNTCHDFFRREYNSNKRRAFIKFSEVPGNEGYRSGCRFEAIVKDPNASPAELLAREETRDEVRTAVEELAKSSHRAVIALRFFDGLQYGEAAKKLGITMGTFKSRLHAAKKKLAELIPHMKQDL